MQYTFAEHPIFFSLSNMRWCTSKCWLEKKANWESHLTLWLQLLFKTNFAHQNLSSFHLQHVYIMFQKIIKLCMLIYSSRVSWNSEIYTMVNWEWMVHALLLNEGIPRALKGKKLRLKIPRVLPSIFEFILVIQIWG